jgi:aromatic ring-opening dioxygenase catalytic subunit (LigB family)
MQRLPTLYISHGGGPAFWLPPPFAHEFASLRVYFAGLLDQLPARPSAIVVISGHWEAALPTVSTSPAPPMLFDYYGMPAHTYALNYPAPGSPALAHTLRGLLTDAGIATGIDAERGFDHGVFVPFLIVDPAARIPVVMLSLREDFDPSFHLAVGAALEPLRDEGVLIVGSGSSYHNLRGFTNGQSAGSAEFDAWLTDAVTAPDPALRNAKLVDWERAPHARTSHPREDHLLPLMVAAGAAGGDIGRVHFHALIFDKHISGYVFGR